jgi:hypothetical protein
VAHRYCYNTHYYEGETSWFFLSDEELSDKEWEEVCRAAIKKALLQNVHSEGVVAVDTKDLNMVEVHKISCEGKYSFCLDYGEMWLSLDSLAGRVIQNIQDRGFELEHRNVRATFSADEYTYTRHNFEVHVREVMKERIRNKEVLKYSDDDLASGDLSQGLTKCRSLETAKKVVAHTLKRMMGK